MSRVYLILLSFILLASCKKNEKTLMANTNKINKFSDAVLREIYIFQDQRQTDSLLNFFNNESSIYRAESALAFGSVQDTSAITGLIKLLNDSTETVRKNASYALGQIGNSNIEDSLIKQIKKEKSTLVTNTLLEALGKCATEKGVNFLASFYGNPVLDEGVSAGLFRASLKSVQTESGLKRIIELIRQNQSDKAKILASTYLARNRTQEVTPYFKTLSSVLKNDNNEFVRMNCASALKQSNHSSIPKVLEGALKSDESEFVQIGAIRAMQSFGGFGDLVFNKLDAPKVNIAIVASEYFKIHFKAKFASKLTNNSSILDNYNWRVRSNLLNAMMLHNVSGTKELILDRLQKTESDYETSALLMALTGDLESYGHIVERLYKSESKVIRTAAIEALSVIPYHKNFEKYEKKNPAIKQELAKYFKYAIESGDVGLVYHASNILRDEKLDLKSIYGNYDFLEVAKNKLQLPIDIEAYQELQKTIDLYNGVESKPIEKSTKHLIEWDVVEQIDAEAKFQIHTTKGIIEWKLDVENAPGTVSEMVSLAKKGFFNGKYFHRVVPAFVAQAGCPRGDGFGGLPYTIRSEFAPLSYIQGAVGVASAGKDTESCQWFISHNPTPHLDGRYTIFAQTISGMDVVNKLEIGDKIEKISFTNP
jgi:cyclophilin family peptidyl-prolyl cis-trans isomerase/HEAT repeat protein